MANRVILEAMKQNQEKIKEILSRGTESVYDEKHLREALQTGRKLRVKHGIDPTGPRIHLGRAISLWKLREFQDLGHQIVLVIGDFTAQIGDASDKDAPRRPLSLREIKANMAGYGRQIGKILDMKKVELHYNSEWLAKLGVQELLKLAAHFTSQQMIQRRNFKERWERGNPIGLHEILYPLFQGYDSVATRADVEIGGSDQLFNLQVGREIQKYMGQKPQDIMTMRMLLGTDGRKMSASWGNTISIEDAPEEQFGKVMSLRDELIGDYLELCTRLPMSHIARIKSDLKKKKINPRDAKLLLAEKITELYHGPRIAKRARKEFEAVFQKKQFPSRIPEVRIAAKSLPVLDLLVQLRLAYSRSEARRFVRQGGVRIANKIQRDWREIIPITQGMVVQVGKRKFVRVVCP